MPVPRRLIFALLPLLLCGGCGLFSTRNPEAPATGRSLWETPREPQDVLGNMRLTLADRDAVNYLRSFVPEHFLFIADQVALSRDPSLAGWGYEEEAQHVANLFSAGTLPTGGVLVTFTSITQNFVNDTAEVRAHYDLQAEVALTGVPHHVAGNAVFTIITGPEQFWQIIRWQDSRTEELSTWSDFKSLVR
jgi:hypothetical protein